MYNTLGSFIQYCVDNGYLPDIVNSALIPKMTSNTAPSGEVEASTYYDKSYPYKAFDGSTSTSWASNNVGAGSWIYYKFTTPKIAKKISIYCIGDNSPKTFKIQGSNDNSNWTDISDILTILRSGDEYFNINPNEDAYLYYRFYCVSSYTSSKCDIRKIQLYGAILE